MTDITLDDFQEALDSADSCTQEFVLDFDEDVVELFETGSTSVTINNRNFIIALTFQEVTE